MFAYSNIDINRANYTTTYYYIHTYTKSFNLGYMNTYTVVERMDY